MSLFPDVSSLQSFLPSTLSFTFSELDLLISALLHYQEHLEHDLADPDKPEYYSVNGKSDTEVCSGLLSKLINYSFK